MRRSQVLLQFSCLHYENYNIRPHNISMYTWTFVHTYTCTHIHTHIHIIRMTLTFWHLMSWNQLDEFTSLRSHQSSNQYVVRLSVLLFIVLTKGSFTKLHFLSPYPNATDYISLIFCNKDSKDERDFCMLGYHGCG